MDSNYHLKDVVEVKDPLGDTWIGEITSIRRPTQAKRGEAIFMPNTSYIYKVEGEGMYRGGIRRKLLVSEDKIVKSLYSSHDERSLVTVDRK